MNIIFLDIDGVLNSTRTAIAFNGYPYKMPIQKSLAKFDITAIKLIRKLCKETNSKVVISSTWRGSAKSINCFDNFKLPIIGMTPRLGYAPRGIEIQQWLDNEPTDIDNYCIIDDDSDMLDSQLPYFVKTDVNNGFLFDDYMKATRILKGYVIIESLDGYDIWSREDNQTVLVYKNNRFWDEAISLEVAKCKIKNIY